MKEDKIFIENKKCTQCSKGYKYYSADIEMFDDRQEYNDIEASFNQKEYQYYNICSDQCHESLKKQISTNIENFFGSLSKEQIIFFQKYWNDYAKWLGKIDFNELDINIEVAL